jgi:hypothetical protein
LFLAREKRGAWSSTWRLRRRFRRPELTAHAAAHLWPCVKIFRKKALSSLWLPPSQPQKNWKCGFRVPAQPQKCGFRQSQKCGFRPPPNRRSAASSHRRSAAGVAARRFEWQKQGLCFLVI